MKNSLPAIIILENHNDTVNPWFYENVFPLLFKKGYCHVGDEGTRTEKLTRRDVNEVKSAYQEMIAKHEEGSYEIKGLPNKEISKHVRYQEACLPNRIAKCNACFKLGAEIYGFDFEEKKRSAEEAKIIYKLIYRAVINESPLTCKINHVRDNGMAHHIEKIRKETDQKGEGLVVSVGSNHYGIQNFLLLQHGEEVLKNYRFFYLYRNEIIRDEVTGTFRGYRFGYPLDIKDVNKKLPFGLTQIDCSNQDPKNIYDQICRALQAPPPEFDISAFMLNKRRHLELQLKSGEDALSLLRRHQLVNHMAWEHCCKVKKIDEGILAELCKIVLFDMMFKKKKNYVPGAFQLKERGNTLQKYKITIPPELLKLYQQAIDKLCPGLLKQWNDIGLLTKYDMGTAIQEEEDEKSIEYGKSRLQLEEPWPDLQIQPESEPKPEESGPDLQIQPKSEPKPEESKPGSEVIKPEVKPEQEPLSLNQSNGILLRDQSVVMSDGESAGAAENELKDIKQEQEQPSDKTQNRVLGPRRSACCQWFSFIFRNPNQQQASDLASPEDFILGGK